MKYYNPEMSVEGAKALYKIGVKIGLSAGDISTIGSKVVKSVVGKLDNVAEHAVKDAVSDIDANKLAKKSFLSNIVDDFDLSHHEDGLHGGHAKDRHVEKSKDWLKDRIEKDPRITGSTSFPDLATANKYTRETLLRNANEIEKWLENSAIKTGAKLAFNSEFLDSVGHGFNQNNQYFESINKVNVVLKKTEDGFKIYTAHPLVDKVR